MKIQKQKTNVTSKAPPVPITCTFSRPGTKSLARGKNLAASQALLIRRRHFLLHGHHLPSAVSPRPQDTPLGLVTSLVPRLQLSPPLRVRLPPSSPTRSASRSSPQPDVTGLEFVLRRRAVVTARPLPLRAKSRRTVRLHRTGPTSFSD